MRAALLLLLCACHTRWDESQEDDLRLLTTERVPGPGGFMRLDFEVLPGDGGFAVTGVVADDELIYVDRLVAPDGEVVFQASDHWESDYNYTNAGFSDNVVTLNWPIEAGDRVVEPGFWEVELRTDRTSTTPVSVVFKQDNTFSQGSLNVDILLTGDLANQSALVDGLQDAIGRWRQVIFDDAGIELIAELRSADTRDELFPPGQGDAAIYETLSAARRLRGVTVVIVDTVVGNNAVLGIAGGIPGPLVPTPSSAVVISATEAAGRDGVLSRAEIELLGETMAHEVGHYLGLFHPIEIPDVGERIVSWDNLDDTIDCTNFSGCNQLLGANLMYPIPVCAVGFEADCPDFVGQIELTTEQQGIAQRYTGVY